MNRRLTVIGVLLIAFLVVPLSSQSASIKPTGKLTILYSNLGNESLDCVKWNTGQSEAIVMSLGEPLVNFYWKGPALDFKPAIASSWKISPDLKTWEFTIRKGINFHDGTPLTVQDVVFTWNRVLKSPLSIAVSAKNIIKSVEALNDKTVLFQLNTPDPFFLYKASTYAIQPKAYTEKVGEEEFSKKPIYAGPWKFVKQLQGDFVEMEAFEGHYRKVPYYKTLILKIIPEDSTKLAMLKTGEADIIFNVMPGPLVNEIRNDSNLRLISVPSSNETYLFMTSLVKPDKVSPFRDKRVRQALSLAIDRKLIVEKLYNGLGSPSFMAAIMPYSPMMHPSLTPIRYDIKKAKTLLSEAGYPNGFETELFLTNTEKAEGEAIASMWNKIGVKAKITLMEMGAMLAAVREKTLPDGLRLSHHSCTPAGMWYFFRKGGHYTVIYDDKLEELTNKMATIPEGPKMYEFIKNEMSRYVYDLVPSIPLVIQQYSRGVRKNIETSEWEKIGTRSIFWVPAAEYL